MILPTTGQFAREAADAAGQRHRALDPRYAFGDSRGAACPALRTGGVCDKLRYPSSLGRSGFIPTGSPRFLFCRRELRGDRQRFARTRKMERTGFLRLPDCAIVRTISTCGKDTFKCAESQRSAFVSGWPGLSRLAATPPRNRRSLASGRARRRPLSPAGAWPRVPSSGLRGTSPIARLIPRAVSSVDATHPGPLAGGVQRSVGPSGRTPRVVLFVATARPERGPRTGRDMTCSTRS
ncbi:hypothetical protein SAMN04490248_11976 [Salinihabitans flavidus]|uniref:Uncharacterized protein n=1 Tax=Salinihabitans flavidus TaxID=569882 RepID=A0A1H8UES7_9RHOB|nr:hypothetical protein SAMN04490248_11976 [Salinihabitans flavidus]